MQALASCADRAAAPSKITFDLEWAHVAFHLYPELSAYFAECAEDKEKAALFLQLARHTKVSTHHMGVSPCYSHMGVSPCTQPHGG